MTAKQAQVWDLYASGHRITDIAIATGRSKGNISTMITRIKAAIQNPTIRERSSLTCPYSSSCFTCPLRDCAISSTIAGRYNILPSDRERYGLV